MSTRIGLRSWASAAFCLVFSLPQTGQAPAVQSGAAQAGVKIDGQTGDWSGSSFIFDAKSGAELAFQDNGRDLYVLFILKKPETRAALESTGVTVLARTAGAIKSRGVLFLKRTVPAETTIRWKESQGEPLTEREKAKLREDRQHDLCFAFAVGESGSIHGPLRRLRESEPPEFAVSEGTAGMIYELRIPLLPPDLVPGGLGAWPGETLRISFEWGGASRKILSPKTTMEASALERKADVSGSGATWAQEFLDMFDSMSRPTRGTKKFAVAVELKLAENESEPGFGGRAPLSRGNPSGPRY
jgi:hypothetical protein